MPDVMICTRYYSCSVTAQLRLILSRECVPYGRPLLCRLVFLHEGRVVWEGTTDEFENSELPIVKQFRTGGLKGPIQYV